jgi:hypothetical protein
MSPTSDSMIVPLNAAAADAVQTEEDRPAEFKARQGGARAADEEGPSQRPEELSRPGVHGETTREGPAEPAPDDEITDPPQLHAKDMNGCDITEIFWSTKKFAIYEAGDQIKYTLPNKYEVARALRHRAADLGGLRAAIEDLRAEPSLARNEKTRAAREVAWALAQAFEDSSNPPSQIPKEVLSRVDARLRSLVKSHYRMRYALANMVAFAIIEIVLILFASGFELAGTSGGNLAAVPRYATYMALGALGAFLSVLTGIRSVDLDLNLTKWEHVFSGATRIMIGVIGALVIGLALDSRLIDPTFGFHDTVSAAQRPAVPGALDKHVAMYLIFAFLAGFSESLVPNLLRKSEQTTGGVEKPASTKDAIVQDMKP